MDAIKPRKTREAGTWLVIYSENDQVVVTERATKQAAGELISNIIPTDGKKLLAIYKGARRVETKTKVVF
jgi:hypothetical protein